MATVATAKAVARRGLMVAKRLNPTTPRITATKPEAAFPEEGFSAFIISFAENRTSRAREQ